MGEIVPYKKRCVFGGVRGTLTAVMIFAAVVAVMCGVCVLTFALARFTSGEDRTASTAAFAREAMPVIVIDAGHGGIDSGAVGVDGTLEKQINLAVAEKLAALCRISGIDCALTRKDDNMLVDGSVTSHRKMHDLKNRLALTDELASSGCEVILVSVHMNNFPSPKYSGLQVWYSTNDSRSCEIAACVQNYARTWLDTSNARQIKPATSAIYVLDRANVPAVLVECGFLSNPDECARLGTSEYQTQLAVTVFAALCEYILGQK